MKLNIFILMILCLVKTQEQWVTIYQSFQEAYKMDESGWIVSNNKNGNLFSTCNGVSLFGGFDVFGATTIVSKHFSLPPHNQLKINLEFYTFGQWHQDIFYIITDDQEWSKQYDGKRQTTNTSNSHTYSMVQFQTYIYVDLVDSITVIRDHSRESQMLIMTTNQTLPADKQSWGFRDFTLSIVRCPQGCLYCSDNDYNNCYYWIGFLSLWHQSMVLDGWMKNDILQPTTYTCVSCDLVYLASGDKLEKMIENLTPHFRMQVNLQLWKIDTLNSENFQVLVDDQIYNQTVLQSTGLYSICGSMEKESIFNIVITISHSQSSCKITMRTNQTAYGYWGIRAFNIYLAKCYNGCDQCLSSLKTDCTLCSNGWVLYKNLCTNSPPMLLSQISIRQIKVSQSDDRIPIEINLLEVDQQITTLGNFTLSVNNTQKILTIQAYVKCLPNTRIKNQFSSNKFQDLQQYSFFTNCQQLFNTVIYNVQYEQIIIAKLELIINISDKQCVIYQVIKVIDELTQFIKILDIILEDI